MALDVRHPTNTTLRALEDLFVHNLVERRAEREGEPGQGRPYEWRIQSWVAAVLESEAPTITQIQVGARKATVRDVEQDVTPHVNEGLAVHNSPNLGKSERVFVARQTGAHDVSDVEEPEF